jgi:hypothetical protein
MAAYDEYGGFRARMLVFLCTQKRVKFFPCFRNPMLYPTELQAQTFILFSFAEIGRAILHHEFVHDHVLDIASSNTNLLIANCLQGFQTQARLSP